MTVWVFLSTTVQIQPKMEHTEFHSIHRSPGIFYVCQMLGFINKISVLFCFRRSISESSFNEKSDSQSDHLHPNGSDRRNVGGKVRNAVLGRAELRGADSAGKWKRQTSIVENLNGSGEREKSYRDSSAEDDASWPNCYNTKWNSGENRTQKIQRNSDSVRRSSGHKKQSRNSFTDENAALSRSEHHSTDAVENRTPSSVRFVARQVCFKK